MPVDASQLRIATVPMSQVQPYPGNPRRGDVETIAESLQANGQYRALITQRSTGYILAGNHTYLAAQLLGWHEIAISYVDVDDEQAARIVAVDNRSSDKASYDVEGLLKLLDGLPDLAGTGYDQADMNELLAQLRRTDPKSGLTDPDEVPQLSREPITEPGDVWALGPHRVMCGDARDPAQVATLMADAQVDLVVTDPPYGVEVEGRTPDSLTILNDAAETLDPLLRASFDALLEVCKPGACWYVFGPGGPVSELFLRALIEREIVRQQLIWVKDAFVLGRSDYHYQHEVIFYGWKPGAKHQRPPDRRQATVWRPQTTTVWEVDRPKASREHPTTKPVELIQRALNNSSSAHAVVGDVFLGSGSTLIACEQLDRRLYGMELDPRYADVAVRRWMAFTGKQARKL